MSSQRILTARGMNSGHIYTRAPFKGSKVKSDPNTRGQKLKGQSILDIIIIVYRACLVLY